MTSWCLLAAVCLLATTQPPGIVDPWHKQAAIELELYAAPLGSPDQPLQRIGLGWSRHDFEDSVVIKVRVREVGSDGTGAVIAHAQYRAGRRVGVVDNPEVMDPDATSDMGRWLPAFASFYLPLGDARSSDAGDLVAELGFFRPLTDHLRYNESDAQLVLTHVRVKASLIREGGEQYSQEDSTIADFILGW